MKMRTVTGILAIVLITVLCLWAGTSPATGLESKLVIVTSYPKDLTGPFKKAFEAKYPGTEVEVFRKKHPPESSISRKPHRATRRILCGLQLRMLSRF